MIVLVDMSMVILVPGLSKARSILGRQPTTQREPEDLTRIFSGVIT